MPPKCAKTVLPHGAVPRLRLGHLRRRGATRRVAVAPWVVPYRVSVWHPSARNRFASRCCSSPAARAPAAARRNAPGRSRSLGVSHIVSGCHPSARNRFASRCCSSPAARAPAAARRIAPDRSRSLGVSHIVSVWHPSARNRFASRCCSSPAAARRNAPGRDRSLGGPLQSLSMAPKRANARRRVAPPRRRCRAKRE